MTLWQGRLLTIRTVAIEQLIASKLIRYDEIDQSDIRYLVSHRNVGFNRIAAAAKRLPPPFHCDPVVLGNLQNLKTGMEIWGDQPS